MTSEIEKEKAELIVQEINEQLKKQYSFIDYAIVDDFGRFGNFSIIIHLKKLRQGTFGSGVAQRIKGIINTISKKHNGKLRGIEFPTAMYTTYCGISSFHGYYRNYISIDLDFRVYNEITNTFAQYGK